MADPSQLGFSVSIVVVVVYCLKYKVHSCIYILKVIKSADCAFSVSTNLRKKCENRDRSAKIIKIMRVWYQCRIFVENIFWCSYWQVKQWLNIIRGNDSQKLCKLCNSGYCSRSQTIFLRKIQIVCGVLQPQKPPFTHQHHSITKTLEAPASNP